LCSSQRSQATLAGPGGLVYGILITLPALALAPLFQIAARVGFWGKERKTA